MAVVRLRPHPRPDQVFKTDGTFVKELFVSRIRLGMDPSRHILIERSTAKYLYVADGSNMKIHVVQRDRWRS